MIAAAVETFGLLDYDDSALSGESGFASSLGAGSQKRGEVIGRTQIVTLLTSEFEASDLEIDKKITVDGVEYVIRLSLAHSHMALNLTSVYLGKS